MKTVANTKSVEEFLAAVQPAAKQNDARSILEIMSRITEKKPVMWGESIIGFGEIHYKSAAGTEGDWFKVGFSPRKQALTLYFLFYVEKEAELLAKLGKFKTGKGCIYVKSLKDIDIEILKVLVKKSFEIEKIFNL